MYFESFVLPSSDSNHDSNIIIDTIKVAHQKEHKTSFLTCNFALDIVQVVQIGAKVSCYTAHHLYT